MCFPSTSCAPRFLSVFPSHWSLRAPFHSSHTLCLPLPPLVAPHGRLSHLAGAVQLAAHLHSTMVSRCVRRVLDRLDAPSSLFRYVRLWVNLWAIWRYKPAMPLDHPSFTSQDLTVVIPTIAWDINQLRETVKSAYALEPAAMIVVTPETQIKKVDRMVEKLNQPKAIRVMTTRQANKRRQLSRAIPEVRTGITLFMDDDVWLPRHFIKWILAPFEDPRTGGAGTNQAIRRKNWQNLWEWLGAVYLIRRNFDCTACNWIDGGLPCLSGRAVAYRTRILQDPSFTYGFTHETWGSEHFLNVDDDNFVTRWLFSHNWKIKLQNHRECLVETTLETSNKFLKQCLRWVRSNWRSNMTTLGESHMWRSVGPAVHGNGVSVLG